MSTVVIVAMNVAVSIATIGIEIAGAPPICMKTGSISTIASTATGIGIRTGFGARVADAAILAADADNPCP